MNAGKLFFDYHTCKNESIIGCKVFSDPTPKEISEFYDLIHFYYYELSKSIVTALLVEHNLEEQIALKKAKEIITTTNFIRLHIYAALKEVFIENKKHFIDFDLSYEAEMKDFVSEFRKINIGSRVKKKINIPQMFWRPKKN